MIDQIDTIKNNGDFIAFLNDLANDFQEHPEEWYNLTIPEYLMSVASWLEDVSENDESETDWENTDFKTIAKMFYMGKLYE